MTIIASYDITDAELNISPEPQLTIRIYTAIESNAELRELNASWDDWNLVSSEDFDRFIRKIINARHTLSRTQLQNDPINQYVLETSNRRFQFLHCTTVYCSDHPNRILISLEIGLQTQN